MPRPSADGWRALTGPADQRLLVLLRSLCDVLLVGAGTVRAEGYGPVDALPALADVRRAAGQQAAPRLAVLTRNIELDLASAAFTEAKARPIVVTTEAADPARVREAEQVADVLVAGERTVDLRLRARAAGRGPAPADPVRGRAAGAR